MMLEVLSWIDCITQMLLMALFLFGIADRRYGYKVSVVLFVSVFALMLLVFDGIRYAFPRKMLITFSLIALAVAWLCKGSWLYRLRMLGILLFAMLSSEVLALTLYTIFFKGLVSDFVQPGPSIVLGGSLYSIIFTGVAAIITVYYKGAHKKTKRIILGAGAGMPIAQCMLLCGSFFYSVPRADIYFLVYITTCQCFILLANSALFGAIWRSADNAKMETEMQLLRTQAEEMRAYHVLVQDHEEKIRGMRHDLANQLQAAYVLFQNGEHVRAQTMLQTLQTQLSSTQTIRYCEHALLNTVLTVKFARAHACNVETQAKILWVPDYITDTDLCSLLSNLLDNAIEACRRLPASSPRFVSVKLAPYENSAVLCVENTCLPDMKHSGKQPLPSMKADEDDHGWGTKQIISIAKRYGGEAAMVAEDGVFRTTISFSIAPAQSNLS